MDESIATGSLVRRRVKPFVQWLERAGVARPRPGRQAALLSLVARIRAPIQAQRIGIHPARAAQWARIAGSTYADYIAPRTAA